MHQDVKRCITTTRLLTNCKPQLRLQNFSSHLLDAPVIVAQVACTSTPVRLRTRPRQGNRRRHTCAIHSALVPLLDFAKAYDSLAPALLLAVLRRCGFPESFLQVVNTMHTGTRSRFLVKGFLSHQLEVKCGIRYIFELVSVSKVGGVCLCCNSLVQT